MRIFKRSPYNICDLFKEICEIMKYTLFFYDHNKIPIVKLLQSTTHNTMTQVHENMKYYFTVS